MLANVYIYMYMDLQEFYIELLSNYRDWGTLIIQQISLVSKMGYFGSI